MKLWQIREQRRPPLEFEAGKIRPSTALAVGATIAAIATTLCLLDIRYTGKDHYLPMSPPTPASTGDGEKHAPLPLGMTPQHESLGTAHIQESTPQMHDAAPHATTVAIGSTPLNVVTI